MIQKCVGQSKIRRFGWRIMECSKYYICSKISLIKWQHIGWCTSYVLWNKTFEFNVTILQSQVKPISKLKSCHNCSQSAKRNSNKENSTYTELYLCVEAEVMFTSKLWSDVWIHNLVKGEDIDSI